MKPPDYILERLQTEYGFNDSVCQGICMESAIRIRMEATAEKTFEEYFDVLGQSHIEFNAFVEELLVPESWFFRDGSVFKWLGQWVTGVWLPYRSASKRMLNILSFPCAAGQEPYSIAMALLDIGLRHDQFKITAVDISEPLLQVGRNGAYPLRSFRGIDMNPYIKHFDKVNDESIVMKSAIRSRIDFKCFNVAHNWSELSAQPFDIIFFRNLLIYLNEDMRKHALQQIVHKLDQQGLLIIGHADHIQTYTEQLHRAGPPAAFCYSFQQNEEPSQAEVKAPTLTPLRKVAGTFQSPFESAAISEKEWPTINPRSEEIESIRGIADAGKLKEAEQQCRNLLAGGQHEPECYFLLGQILTAKGAFREAEECYRKTAYLDSAHSDALFQLALLAEKRSDHSRAELLKKRARKADPERHE